MELVLIILILILGIICLIFLFYGYHFLKHLIERVEKLIPLTREFNEFFYILSENNHILKELKDEQNLKYHNHIPKYNFDNSWSENNPIICHALGELDGIRFTECKEAFLYHYSKGSRIFEVDFCLTRDGIPVILHDWETFNYGKMSGKRTNKQNKSMNETEFAQVKILGKYTPLTLDRFIQIVNDYNDAWFIISVKSINQQYDENTVGIIFHELFTKSDAVNSDIKKRYILHAYSMDFLHKTMEKYQFTSVIYRISHTIHPQILAEEMKRYGITVVTTLDRWYVNPEYCRILHENGIKIIICIVQDNNNETQKLLSNGADMIMSPKGETVLSYLSINKEKY